MASAGRSTAMWIAKAARFPKPVQTDRVYSFPRKASVFTEQKDAYGRTGLKTRRAYARQRCASWKRRWRTRGDCESGAERWAGCCNQHSRVCSMPMRSCSQIGPCMRNDRPKRPELGSKGIAGSLLVGGSFSLSLTPSLKGWS